MTRDRGAWITSLIRDCPTTQDTRNVARKPWQLAVWISVGDLLYDNSVVHPPKVLTKFFSFANVCSLQILKFANYG